MRRSAASTPPPAPPSNPATATATPVHVDAACAAAAEAFPAYRATTSEQRARFLEAIAANLEAIKARPRRPCRDRSPAFPRAASPARSDAPPDSFACSPPSCARAAGPARASTPPSPTEPRCRVPTSASAPSPLGPVAVFGASNFPLAFSVAGGDTASALAAGCPVVVKAHDAHPGTSELVGRAIADAVAASGLPAGHVLAAVRLRPGPRYRTGHRPADQGRRLHRIPFRRNGSGRRGRRPARADPGLRRDEFDQPGVPARRRACRRAVPTSAARSSRSLTMGSGQFCTNPGLVIAVDGPGLDTFLAAARDALAQAAATPMLTPAIAESYADGVAALAGHADLVARGEAGRQPDHLPGRAVQHGRRDLPGFRGAAGRGVRLVEPRRPLRRRRRDERRWQRVSKAS